MISIYAKAPVITKNKQSHLLISFIFLNSQDHLRNIPTKPPPDIYPLSRTGYAV